MNFLPKDQEKLHNLTNRRGMLKKLGALAAGIGGACLLRPKSSEAATDAITAGALTFLAGPLRLVDTRTGSGYTDAGNHYGSDTLRTYNIRSLAGLPAGATGVVGGITTVNSTAQGLLQMSPNPPPGAGNDLGFGTGIMHFPPASSSLVAFRVPYTTALDGSGQIRLHSTLIGGGAQTVDIVLDVVGYYS